MITCENGNVEMIGTDSQITTDAIFIFESLKKAGLLALALTLYEKIPEGCLVSEHRKWRIEE